MLNLLVGLGSQVVSGYLETKKAKAENKLTEIKAKTDILNKQIDKIKEVTRGDF